MGTEGDTPIAQPPFTDGAELLALIDRAKSKIATDPKEAQRLGQHALALAQDANDPAAKAAAEVVLGQVHLQRGQSQRALHRFLDALRYYRDVDKKLATSVLCSIGVAQALWGNAPEAIDVLRRALDDANALADRELAARARNGLAMTLAKQGIHDEAREHLEENLRLARTHPNEVQLAVVLNNLGASNCETGRFDDALSCWEEALAVNEDDGNERGAASALMNLAKFHFDRGNLAEAEEPLRRGLVIVERYSLMDHLEKGLLLLAAFEEARGNLADALDATRRLNTLKDEKFNEVRTRNIAEMQARFDMETAEREVERTKLRSRELSDALRQADRLGAVGRLAGGIAHDFNNVLTAMTGYADLILMTVDEDNPVRDYVREIRRGGERAAQLTHQLLAFSRKQVLQPEVLDLSDAVRDLIKMLRRLLGEDVDLRTELGSELPPIFVDSGQVEQIIVNLAVNARDAMPEGGLLQIRTRSVPAEEVSADVCDEVVGDRFVCLDVSDRGTGIPSNVIEYIFEPFFTTKNESEGTGLGLATVYGIVVQSGGTIRVESVEGEGTAFTIYFPQTHRAPTLAVQPKVEGELPGGLETVLVVEDNGAVRELTRQILAVCGYRVLAVSDPESGLDVVSEHPGTIDLLLTDVVLPGMRGTEMAARALATRPEMRVLYMSGYPFEALNDKGTLSDDIELVQKPFTPAELARHVRYVLDRADAPQA